MINLIKKSDDLSFGYSKCYLVGQKIPLYREYVKYLKRGVLSVIIQLYIWLGYKHIFPEELKEFTPIEEKLIALNLYYRFITKYNILEKQR